MKINLISMHIRDSVRAVPLATALLASNIKAQLNDVSVNLIDTFLNTSKKDAIKLALNGEPDIIGFSIYLWNRTFLLDVIKAIKKQNPDITIIVGGPEVTADFDFFKEQDSILSVPGEGENIIISIIKQLKAGVSISDIQETIQLKPIKDLDSIPSPILDGTFDLQKKGVLWELSRGCPFNCSFCYESKGINKVRRFSIDRINRELELIAESNIEQVFVLDPTFNYDKEIAKQILELIAIKAPHITFYFEIRSEFLDEEMAYLFAQTTCIVQIGLQSIHSKVLETVNRNVDIELFENKTLLLHQAGVPYGFDLIYGLPKDSLKNFCKSIDFVIGLAPNHLDIFPLAVLPGTQLADDAEKYELNYQKENPYTIITSPSFPEKEMKRAEKIAKACEVFYNQGKAVPWFGIIIRALKIKPSKFFLQFANWENSIEENDILTKQVKFVEQMFLEMEQTNFAMIAADIITYFAKLDDFLEQDDVYDNGLKCSDNFDLYYNPNELQDLMDAGVTELDDLDKNINLSPCNVCFEYIQETDMIDIIFN
ncbi:MAG: DUF4080 domain-containing protein [Kiritimatiellae bacterium]|jgi:radical SAM superfamily enzyme YgiQ (UPF0313 family)|nr:DUF4080 domain-containing protein [Kiritimatiellia bacterium]